MRPLREEARGLTERRAGDPRHPRSADSRGDGDDPQPGHRGASARAIATTAGVNQALVFYHFGSVTSCSARPAGRAAGRVAGYHDRLAAVTTLRELLTLARTLLAANAARRT